MGTKICRKLLTEMFLKIVVFKDLFMLFKIFLCFQE